MVAIVAMRSTGKQSKQDKHHSHSSHADGTPHARNGCHANATRPSGSVGPVHRRLCILRSMSFLDRSTLPRANPLLWNALPTFLVCSEIESCGVCWLVCGPSAGTTRGARPSPLVRSALSGFSHSLRAVQSEFSTFVECIGCQNNKYVATVRVPCPCVCMETRKTWGFLYPKPRS